MTHLLATYEPLPITFSGGEGVWLWDQEGKRYLDGHSGFGVNALGYNHREWINFVKDQVEAPIHISNLFVIPEKEKLAAKLCALTQMEKAFFVNSGSEANETAIKLTRLFARQKGIKDPTIIVFDGAFHGRTIATLTASSQRHVQAGYEPLAHGFLRAPFNDIEALNHIALSRHDVVAVLIEPIQGIGGIHVATSAFLHEIRALCDKHQWLMICDEIQCGIARTGQFLQIQHEAILPDMVTLSKALGNGIPISACLTRGVVNDLFTPEKHGSTQGGNPFACAVALKTLEIIEKQVLSKNAAEQGSNLIAALKEQFARQPLVKEVRGNGLMIGIELQKPCKAIAEIALEQGLLINVTNQNVLRILPPLVIQTRETILMSEKLKTIIDFFAAL